MVSSCFSHVWFFADIPHVLKNVRNHILDDGLYIGVRDLDNNRPVIDKALMVKLVEDAAGPEFKMCCKLTAEHTTVRVFCLFLCFRMIPMYAFFWFSSVSATWTALYYV